MEPQNYIVTELTLGKDMRGPWDDNGEKWAGIMVGAVLGFVFMKQLWDALAPTRAAYLL